MQPYRNGRQELTDLARWSDLRNFDDEWKYRSICAARYVPPGAVVLDVGCGKMALEKYLPQGCAYIPSDLVARDERTIVCDLNKGEYPPLQGVTHITALGVLEYIHDLGAFWKWLGGSGARVICSYIPLRMVPRVGVRRSHGWVNHLTGHELIDMARSAGLKPTAVEELRGDNIIFAFEPVRSAADS